MLQKIKTGLLNKTFKWFIALLLSIGFALVAYELLRSVGPLTEAEVVGISSNALQEYTNNFQLDIKLFVLLKIEYMDSSDRWLVTYKSPYPDANELFVIIKPDKDYEISMSPAVKYNPPNN